MRLFIEQEDFSAKDFEAEVRWVEKNLTLFNKVEIHKSCAIQLLSTLVDCWDQLEKADLKLKKEE